MRVHEQSVVQGSAHSYVTVIRHYHQQDTLCSSKGQDKVELNHATSIRDGLLQTPEVDQQLGDRAGGVAEIQEGEV